MHEHQFPESDEPGAQRSARAVAALQYEEDAGLGFRRRAYGAGDPWAEPLEFQVDRESSNAQLAAGYAAGAGVVCGGLSLMMRPLPFALACVLLSLVGLTAGGNAAKTAKIGLIVGSACFVLGMIFAILAERPVI